MSPPEIWPGAVFDLSARTKLRVTGNDRLRFLNGQLTNNIDKADTSRALAACVLNAKGKMNAHVFFFIEGDSVVLDADPELRESLVTRLERYIISDDVQIEDVTDQFALFHSFPADSSFEDRVSANRFRRPGFDSWVDISRHDEVLRELSGTRPLCDQTCAEIFRVEQGIPRWGRELTEEIIPLEANLEGSCVDYEKGCYIGQEVISRMKMSGQRNKSLCGLIAGPDLKRVPGMRLETPSGPGPGREVGWITSSVYSERAKGIIALGYVKRGFNAKATRLTAIPPKGSSEASPALVTVVELPFAFADS